MAKHPLSEALAELSKSLTLVDDESLLEAGHLAINIVSLRTKKGIDADGSTFKEYSQDYKKERWRKGLATRPVDLTVKGHMLGALEPTVTGKNEVTISFNNPLEAAKAAGNSRTRDFLDVRMDKELEVIAEVIADSVSKK